EKRQDSQGGKTEALELRIAPAMFPSQNREADDQQGVYTRRGAVRETHAILRCLRHGIARGGEHCTAGIARANAAILSETQPGARGRHDECKQEGDSRQPARQTHCRIAANARPHAAQLRRGERSAAITTTTNSIPPTMAISPPVPISAMPAVSCGLWSTCA